MIAGDARKSIKNTNMAQNNWEKLVVAAWAGVIIGGTIGIGIVILILKSYGG